MPAFNFAVHTGNITLRVDWSPGSNTFECWANPFSDNIHGEGQAPYGNDQGVPELDNGVALVYFPDGSRFRVRVLYSDRPNGDAWFRTKGDVVTAYKQKDKQEQQGWDYVGNVVTGDKHA